LLKSKLLHPQIIAALGRSGHSSKVLVADGNFPHWTRRGPNAEVVYLNLAPGMLSVADVLAALLTEIVVETAEVMDYARAGPYALASDPPARAAYERILRAADQPLTLKPVERFAFYQMAQSPDVCLTVATGDQAIYANLLLTIGVVRP
jgi:L-fucose mutarotase